MSSRRSLGAVGLTLCVSALLLSASAAQAPPGPRLAVLLVIDQMRADYIDRFQQDWTAGLKRMVSQGAWFRQAAYPYLTTETCPGHATISTGTFPRTHGIIQNNWWDRDTQSLLTCTEDRSAKNVSYGLPIAGSSDSAWRIAVPTIADAMRAQRGARVVALSLKDRSALMMAGRSADAVTWFSDTSNEWTTSSTFTTIPVPEVRAFVQAHPIKADYGKLWTRLLPSERYPQADHAIEEGAPSGWARTFPHALNGAGRGPDPLFYAQWRHTPHASGYLARLALTLVESMKLGAGPTTDLLAISFSSPDFIGHAFGPDSQEVQDAYAHLDRTIGELLDRLDMLVGVNQYVVALAADHGVSAIPERMAKAGRNAGRLSASVLAAVIEERVEAALGPGRYLLGINGNDVYFAPGAYERLAANPSAMSAVIEGVKKAEGIGDLYPEERLRTGTTAADPRLRAAALSYFPGRSGEMVIAPKPGWMHTSATATHASGHAEDQRVPIVLFGLGVRQGVFDRPATPADIAPTLAALSGFAMANVDGRVLEEALR